MLHGDVEERAHLLRRPRLEPLRLLSLERDPQRGVHVDELIEKRRREGRLQHDKDLVSRADPAAVGGEIVEE